MPYHVAMSVDAGTERLTGLARDRGEIERNRGEECLKREGALRLRLSDFGGQLGELGVRAVGGYLYEPDGAVIRAGLVTAVAAGVDGGLVDPKIAYVTADQLFRTPFARSYRILETLPYREHQVSRGDDIFSASKEV